MFYCMFYFTCDRSFSTGTQMGDSTRSAKPSRRETIATQLSTRPGKPSADRCNQCRRKWEKARTVERIYRVGQKTRPLYIFANIQAYLANYKRQQLYEFLHTSRPVYSEHDYNMRIQSFYYCKWCHLVNRLPLNNGTLKLQRNGVGRRLAHRQGKRCVCGTEGQSQQSIIVMRRFFGEGLLHPCKMRPLQVDVSHHNSD